MYIGNTAIAILLRLNKLHFFIKHIRLWYSLLKPSGCHGGCCSNDDLTGFYTV